MHFDSGKLNRRITFISYSEVDNEIGQLIQQPVPIKMVWAFIEPLRGHQQTEAQRLSSETTYKILTRYHKGINQEMLINYEGKKLYIHQVLDVEERHFALEITATWKGEMWD
ncbi:phage head closure protein [Cellulosilyticum sp. ST5]|uniref:phage head closure protein n=1 Tax=Cellulosilyticum sp. ST5 TaxID=3055805 RepID=UPI0039775CA1